MRRVRYIGCMCDACKEVGYPLPGHFACTGCGKVPSIDKNPCENCNLVTYYYNGEWVAEK